MYQVLSDVEMLRALTDATFLIKYVTVTTFDGRTMMARRRSSI